MAPNTPKPDQSSPKPTPGKDQSSPGQDAGSDGAAQRPNVDDGKPGKQPGTVPAPGTAGNTTTVVTGA